ncbi:hypothetical protein EDD85DRAFT_1022928 [Armillaria nabsnona]|nr:hypothetical protein EDD85DRAFT_1022928 [Armillaria nabsnona]
MNLETSLPTMPIPGTADASSYLDAFMHSLPKPTFPPDGVYPLVTDILRATRPLLDTDHDWIHPNIALLEGQLPMYDTLIDRLYTIVEELEGHREAIQVAWMQFSSILAPIRRLPSKVLRSIFRETQSTQSDSVLRWYSKRPTIKFMQDTLILGQVCRSWRDIVISSPELWSHFKIMHCSSESDNTSPHNLQSLLKTILPLSGQLPLDIQFISNERTSSGDAIAAFSLLLGERHRWRSASLEIPLDLFEQFRASGGKLACLESLTLMAHSALPMDRSIPPRDGSTSPPGDVNDVFVDALSLRKVVLHQSTGNGSFAFPCQITHLAAPLVAIHNLHTHSLLEELHLKLKEKDIDSIAFPPRITLPNVRRLSASSPKLLRHLCLPSLEDLTFGPNSIGAQLFTQDAVDAASEILNDFIRSSRCSLTSLATGTPIAYASDFIRETLPMLEFLTSLEFEMDEEGIFCHALTSSPILLPNLQHLTMRLGSLPEIYGMPLVPWDALSAMMDSRRNHLLSVRCDCPASNYAAGSLKTELEQLRQLGIDLRIVDLNSSPGITFGNFA